MPPDTDADQDRRERTARRAYEIWERDGRPSLRDLDHWLAAESELRRESLTEAGPDDVPVSNLDRALPPTERARAREARHPQTREGAEPAPAEHFVVIADRAAVRIFAEEHPRGRAQSALRMVQTQLFPEGHEEYFERDTSPQGRFPGNTRHGGMSIDERLPMQREQERRLIRLIGGTIAAFLRKHPAASWDFAAGAPLQRAILDELDPAMRARLRRAVAKELANHPVETLSGHFADTAQPSS